MRPPANAARWRGRLARGAGLGAVLAAPVALAGLVVATTSLGLALSPALLGGLIAVAVVAAGVLTWRRRWIGGGALVGHLALLLLVRSYCAAPLPPGPAFDQPLPAAHPPPGMALVQLPTGRTRRTAAFAYRGGGLDDPRAFTMTAVLVRHPGGDLLLDTGLGRDVHRQPALMPWTFRLLTRVERGRSAAEQLAAAGYDLRRLRGVLLTHAHWDHASGLAELPGVPVLVSPAERAFIRTGGWLTAVARAAPAARFEELAFAGGPYLGFPRSHDVYGDGAVVVVPAPGHTPGSVVVFVTVPAGTRYAFVGDLAWQREGITRRAERPWFVRRLADHDPAQVRAALVHLSAIARRYPELVLVPAHDARGFAGLPTLDGAAVTPAR